MNKMPSQSAIRSLPNISRQAGWTFWSLAFTLGVLSFFAYVGMQLVPIYSNNANIEKAMSQSLEGQNLKTVRRSDILLKMSRQLLLDGSQQAVNFKKELVMQRARSVFILELEYQRTVPLFGNISVLVDFHPRFECNFTGDCEKKAASKE